MAQLTRTAGQSLSLSEVRAFFDGKFDPATAGVDGSSLSHYLRDGGIVRSVSDGGGGEAVAEQFTVTANGAITNPTTSAGTQVYQRTDFHGRIGRNSNGADNASTGPGTWGVYPDGSDFVNTNVAGLDIEVTPLTVGADYALIFNVQDQADNNIEATFEAFQVNDVMSIIRNNGGDSGNGYQFELRGVPVSIEQNDGDTRNVIVAMDARVTRIFGDGTMTDQLLDASINDTLTVTRGATVANPPTIRFQLDGSISPSTLDVTITAGQTTVLEQQEVIYTALGGVSGLTRVAAVADLVDNVAASLATFTIGSSTTSWFPATAGDDAAETRSGDAFPTTGDIFLSIGSGNPVDLAGLGIGTLPFDVTTDLTVSVDDALNSGASVFSVTRVSSHTRGSVGFTTFTLDAATRTGSATLNGGRYEFRVNQAVPEHITYDATGARADTTYSVVTAGAAGIDGNSYTIDTIQQGANAGGEITYPATGGFAMDDLGQISHTSGVSYSWPTGDVPVSGQTSFTGGASDLDYEPGDGTGALFARFGRVNNTTGAQRQIRNITCEVTFDTVTGSITPFFWVRRGTTNIMFLNPSVSQGDTEVYTINGTFDWATGVDLNFGFFDSSNNFTYTVNYFRVNLEAEEEFEPTGTGGGGGGQPINQDVPTSSPLSLSQLRNVDDGRTP